MVAQIPPVTEFYFQRDVSYSDCASNRAFIEPPPALANIARICVIARLARISDAKGKRLIPTESSETNSSERTRNEYLRCICRVFFFPSLFIPFFFFFFYFHSPPSSIDELVCLRSRRAQ